MLLSAFREVVFEVANATVSSEYCVYNVSFGHPVAHRQDTSLVVSGRFEIITGVYA